MHFSPTVHIEPNGKDIQKGAKAKAHNVFKYFNLISSVWSRHAEKKLIS